MTTTSLASPPTPATTYRDRDRLLQSLETALEAAGLSHATIRLYRHGIRRLYAHLTYMGLDVPLAGVSAEHLREWLNAEKKSGASPATREALHKAARRFWAFLHEEGEVTENVAARLRAPKVPVKVVQVLTRDELDALIRACRKDKTILGLRDETMITVLLDTGLRASELLSLTVEGINRKERRALVMGKGARERLVAFEAKTFRLLDRYHRRAGIEDGALFRDRMSEPLSQAALYLAVRKRGEQAGVKRRMHPHVLRHTWATLLLAEGLREGDVRQLAGWSRSSRMLDRYTQATAAERALEARSRVRLV